MPDVAAVVTTYFPEGYRGAARFDASLEANESWTNHLWYTDGEVQLAVADDGSEWDVMDAFSEWGGERVHEAHVALSMSRLGFFPTAKFDADGNPLSTRRGVGASMNRGFRAAFAAGIDVVLFAQDDWALTADFDLTPWVRLLTNNPDVGMVRLGPPHPDLVGRVHMYPEGWALDLYPAAGGFVFATRPALIHRRFFEFVGPFDEGQSAFEVERFTQCVIDSALEVGRASWKALRAAGLTQHEEPPGDWETRYVPWGNPEWDAVVADVARGFPAPRIVYALPYPWEHVESVELADVEPPR